MFRAYAAPLACALTLLVLLVGWCLRERQRIEIRENAELGAYARAVAGALQGGVQSDMRRGGLRRGRLAMILARVVDKTDVTFIQLRQNEQVLAQAGTIPPALHTQNTGAPATNSLFIYRETVRLQDCPGARPGGGHGFGPPGNDAGATDAYDVELGSGNQQLLLAVDKSRFAEGTHAEHKRLALTATLAVTAILILALAWILSVRAAGLSQQLAAERSRSEQLEELNLAAAGLAHETRNPLGSIRGMAQRLAAETTHDAHRRRALAIMEEADIASTRLSDFLGFARSPTPQPVAIDMNAALHRVADVLDAEFDAQQVRLAVNGHDTRILADPDMLDQVLMNLLLNSLQASASGTGVTVDCAARNGRATLRVSDAGCGMDADFTRRIFKPYVTGRGDGHGIGLAVVRRIVDAHNWQIDVDSQPGVGTTMTISGVLTA